MKRERATEMLEELIQRASGHDWPVEAVQAVWVFGSYSRGAVEPGDVDVAIDLDRSNDRWRSHFVNSMMHGRSPFGVLRKALRGRRRGYEFVFEREHGYDDVPMTLLWKRGESLATARKRLQAIPIDPTAGRAPRDAMRPCFEGLEHRVPRALREELGELIDDDAVTVDQITLEDSKINDLWVGEQIDHRWNQDSPLRRAAHAALAHLESHGIDPHAVHLHGKDVHDSRTPHFVGFQLRYLSGALNCFVEHDGVQWLEVLHPTRRGPLHALILRPGRQEKLTRRPTDAGRFFH